MLSPGLYEQVINNALNRELLEIPEARKAVAPLDRAEAYTFLGTANYMNHNGSRPMNITWKLDRPIPAKLLKKTNKLMVG